MRQRDSFESRMTRIRARILDGDYDGALTECDLAEERFEQHWRINLNRGTIYMAEGRLSEARVAFRQVKTHNIECTDRFCGSRAANIGLAMNARKTGWKIEASYHIDVFLKAEPEDISGLWWRGLLLQDLWQNRTPTNNQLLDDAICDLRKAYALISNLPDEKFYCLKILRDISQVRPDEMESRCRATQEMYVLMQINPILDAQTVDEGPDAVDANDLFNFFGPAGFEYMPFIPAGPVHMWIGNNLAYLLSEKKAACTVETIDIFDEIEPLVQQHGDTDFFANTLARASAMNLQIYAIREDVDYLDAAKSKLADLLRLSNTHTLSNEALELIEDLETEIDNFTNASDA